MRVIWVEFSTLFGGNIATLSLAKLHAETHKLKTQDILHQSCGLTSADQQSPSLSPMVVSEVCFPLSLFRLIIVLAVMFALEGLKLCINLSTAVVVLVTLCTYILKEWIFSSWQVYPWSREADALVICVHESVQENRYITVICMDDDH